MNKAVINLLNTIPNQNYFQLNVTYYKPKTCVLICMPMSGLFNEIFLKSAERKLIKTHSSITLLHSILFRAYKRLRDILTEGFNRIHYALKFNMTMKENSNIYIYIFLLITWKKSRSHKLVHLQKTHYI
jgi:hypothetical protein